MLNAKQYRYSMGIDIRAEADHAPCEEHNNLSAASLQSAAVNPNDRLLYRMPRGASQQPMK